MEVEQLEQRGVRLGTQATRSEEYERLRQLRDRELESKQKMWKWLVVLALVVVGAETWLAGRRASRVPRSLWKWRTGMIDRQLAKCLDPVAARVRQFWMGSRSPRSGFRRQWRGDCCCGNPPTAGSPARWLGGCCSEPWPWP